MAVLRLTGPRSFLRPSRAFGIDRGVSQYTVHRVAKSCMQLSMHATHTEESACISHTHTKENACMTHSTYTENQVFRVTTFILEYSVWYQILIKFDHFVAVELSIIPLFNLVVCEVNG